MTRTVAPKERGGRLDLNCARTAPELPISITNISGHSFKIPPIYFPRPPTLVQRMGIVRTVRASDGAPDSPDLRAANVLGGAVNEGDLLSAVETVKIPKYFSILHHFTTSLPRSR